MILKDKRAKDQSSTEPEGRGDSNPKKSNQSDSDSRFSKGEYPRPSLKPGQSQQMGNFFDKNRAKNADISKGQSPGDNNLMRLKFLSYESHSLDSTVRFMCEILKKNDVSYSGPIPLPVSRKRFVVKSSPHVYKDARHRFEIIQSTRMIEFVESASAISALAGVDLIDPSVSVKPERIIRPIKKGKLVK